MICISICLRPLRVAALAATLLAGITGCVQDPTTPSSVGPIQDTLPQERLLQEAEEHFRRGEYAEAVVAYEQALALDSSLSKAYYGYAKATVALSGLDRIAILEDFMETAQDPSQFAFLEHPDSILTLRLQVSKKVRLMLAKLTDRDSLTRWYHYLTDSVPSAEQLADTAYLSRQAFMTDYLLKADLNMPRYRSRHKFPLSDLKLAASSVMQDYTMFELVYIITRLYDFDQNDTIDARDSIVKRLNFGSNGGFTIDSLSGIGDDLETDTMAQANLNDLIATMVSGLYGTSQLAELIGIGGQPDSGSATGGNDNIDSVIASLGDAVLFYQFGDKLDNDGDGCIDEEIMDEKDNDFDGYVDEDARVIPDEKPDGVDNNRDGMKDPRNSLFPLGTDILGYEARVGEALYPGRGYVLKFVYAYLDTTLQNGVKESSLLNPELTTWVKIKKNSGDESVKIRLAIQRDSLAVRIPFGGPVPDSLKAKLQNAKTMIGGCWRNYP